MNKIIVVVVVVLFGCKSYSDDDKEVLGFANKEQRYQVSIYNIAGNPEKFNNKPVFITGYVKFEFGLRIYPDKSSCKDSFSINSISVSVPDNLYSKYAKISKTCDFLSIYGTYQSINRYGKDKMINFSLGQILGDVKLFEY